MPAPSSLAPTRRSILRSIISVASLLLLLSATQPTLATPSNFVAAPHAYHPESTFNHPKKPHVAPAAVALPPIAPAPIPTPDVVPPPPVAVVVVDSPPVDASPILDPAAILANALAPIPIPPVPVNPTVQLEIDASATNNVPVNADIELGMSSTGTIHVLNIEEKPRKEHKKPHNDDDDDDDDEDDVKDSDDDDTLPQCFTLPQSFVHVLGPNSAYPPLTSSIASTVQTSTISAATTTTVAAVLHSQNRHPSNVIKKKLIMNHPTNDRLHRRGGAIYRALGFGGKPKPTVNAANVAADRCAAFCREPSPAVDKSLDKRQWGADDAALWDLTADDVSFEESPAYDDDTAVAPEVEVVAEVKPKKAKYEAAAVWGNRCVCIRRGKIGFAKKMKDASNTCKTCGVDGDPFKGCVVKGKHGHGHGGLKGTRKYFVLKNAKWLDEPANVTTTTTTAAASLATATPVVAAHDKSSPKNKHIAGNAAAAADSLPTSTLLPTSTSLPTASMDHGFPGSHLFPKSRPTVAAVVAIFFAMLIVATCLVVCLVCRVRKNPMRRVPNEEDETPRWRHRSKFFGGDGRWGKPTEDFPGASVFDDEEDDDRTVATESRNGSREGRFA